MKQTLGIAFGAALALALIIVCGVCGRQPAPPPGQWDPGVTVYGGGPRTLWEATRPRTDGHYTGPQSRF